MISKIDIIGIREEEEKSMNNRISLIKDSKLDDLSKRILLLMIEKTTIILIQNLNSSFLSIYNERTNDSFFSYILNNSLYTQYFNNNSLVYSYQSLSDTTCFDSKLDNSDITNNNNNSIIENIPEFKFNSARSSYYLKYDLYDIPIGQIIYNYNHPPRYRINNSFYAFLYPDELITYCLIISGFLSNKNKINFDSINYSINKIDNSQFNSILGLYFCDKNIEIKFGNEVMIKKCAPNEFICKECMEVNKKKYNIKDNYLININGRVAKINKGSFHCFGKYLCGIRNNQIEDCISKFSCKACQMLDYYLKYYFN